MEHCGSNGGTGDAQAWLGSLDENNQYATKAAAMRLMNYYMELDPTDVTDNTGDRPRGQPFQPNLYGTRWSTRHSRAVLGPLA